MRRYNTVPMSSRSEVAGEPDDQAFEVLADLLRNRRNVARTELVRLVGHFFAARAKSDSRDHRGKNDDTLHSQSPLRKPRDGINSQRKTLLHHRRNGTSIIGPCNTLKYEPTATASIGVGQERIQLNPVPGPHPVDPAVALSLVSMASVQIKKRGERASVLWLLRCENDTQTRPKLLLRTEIRRFFAISSVRIRPLMAV